jgi:hypothetical protein
MMPRIDKSMLKSQGGSFPVGSERSVVEEVLAVKVFEEDAVLFTAFISDVYDALASQYSVVTGGAPGVFPVTLEEFTAYTFTALRTRVARVNNDRFPIRCNDPWQLPSVLAAAINGIGRVTLETPVITITPVWNSDYDSFLLDVREWHRITQRLRAVAANSEMKVILVKALADDKAGDESIMSLVPVRDAMGRVVQLRNTKHDVDPIAAVVYLLAGFAPDIYAGLSLATHPLLLPPYYITVAALHQNLWRLTDVA